MVFLTSLDILDTGYLTVTSRNNQLATGNRANSGDELRLKSVSLVMSASSNLDKAVTPAFAQSDIKNHEKRALVSINPTTITITLFLNVDNDDTSNYYAVNDLALLKDLLDLPHTKGFKAIYYPVDNTADDTGSNTSNERNKQLIYQLGATDTSEAQGDINITLWTNTSSVSGKDLTDVNYIPVRFESCNMTQMTTNKIMVTLTGVVTG